MIAREVLAGAVEQAANAIVITDTAGVIQYVNPAFTELTGYTSEEAVGQNARLLKSGCQPPGRYAELWGTITAGNVWRGELVNRRKNGSLYIEEMRVAPVRGPDGRVSHFIAIKQDITARREAEEMKSLLGAVVESSEDAIVSCTSEGVILSWNRGAERLCGYTAEEAVEKNVAMMVPPERRERLAALFGQVLLGESVRQHEGIVLHKDGRRIAVAGTGCPIRDSSGAIVAISVILRDVSARNQIDEAQAMLALIVDSSEDAIKGLDLEGTIVSWNRGAEKLFGYSRDEVAGKPIALLCPPDRLEEVRRNLRIVMKGDKVIPFDTVRLAKDGRPVDVALSVSPIRNSSGVIVGASVIARDISQRLRAERSLLESEERFRGAFENAPHGMAICTIDGKIVQVNDALCQMLGYSEAEFLALTWKELSHPDDFPMTLRAIDGVQTSPERRREYEKRYIHRDGRTVWARVRVSVTLDAPEPLYAVAHIEDITEKKRAEDALRESETRFRGLADCCPTIMWVTAGDGAITYVNRCAREFFSVSNEQVQGAGWLQLLHPDDARQYVETFRLAVERRTGFRAEARVHRADGEWRLIDSYAQPRFSGTDEYLGHVGVSSDITDRRREEQASQFQLTLTRAILEVSLDGILVVSDENRIVSHNQRFLDEIFRIPLKEIPYEVADYWVGDQPPLVLSEVLKRVRNPDAFLSRIKELNSDPDSRDHSEIELKDGRTLERYSTSLRTENGKNLGRIWTFRDITERKQAQLALESSEEKFRQLAENVREVFFVMEAESGRFLYLSPTYEQVWGMPRESAYEDPAAWREAVHPDDWDQVQRAGTERRLGNAFQFEYRIHTPDGAEKWIRTRSFPVRNLQGELIRSVGISEEFTEQKRYEEDLILAREGAEAANRAKSRFLANMSHEIRTPMNGVLGMVQLLLEGQLTAEQRQFAEVAQTSGQTLLALIDDILDLSKIEAHKIVLERLDFNLRQVVQEMARTLNVQASVRGIRIGWWVSSGIPARVNGDPNRLRQVLTNIAANAVKFTEHGSVTIRAELGEQRETGITVRFTITDTGIGIPKDKAAMLFSPFTQADASTTRKYGGTGLGLVITKQLVELMGGAVGFESQEGKGTRFWFTVVLEQASQQSLPGPQEPVLRRLEKREGRPRARILVAEDNATNRMVALAQLKKLGYEADAVNDGEQAVEAVEKGVYGLVLMDCQMPVMDGFEATGRIRRAHPDIPIIALTASAMSGDRETCIRAGMSDYISKPVDLAPLQEMLKKWLPASPPAESIGSGFNEQELLKRLLGDRDLVHIVLKGFLEDVPTQLRELERQLAGQDAAGIGRLAHTLKGAAAAVAAADLRAIAQAIEDSGKVAEFDRCRALMPRAFEEFDRFRSGVERLGWLPV